MSDLICNQLAEITDLLKRTCTVSTPEEISALLEQAIQALKDLYVPLKDLYYDNIICKDLYADIRDLKEHAIEVLGGVEHCSRCDSCCQCKEKEDIVCQGALQLLNDVGGQIDCCNFEAADTLIQEAISDVTKIDQLLCSHCQFDSCNSRFSDSCNSCNSCNSSSCSGSCSSSCSNSSCFSCSSSSSSTSSSSCSSSSSSCSSTSSCSTVSSCC